MLWLGKRVDDGSFVIIDEDIIDGVGDAGRTVIVNENGGYQVVLKDSGGKRKLNALKFAMENGASTPTNTRQSRRNNMMIVSPTTGSPPPSPGPSSSRRRASARPRPTMVLPAGSAAASIVSPTVTQATSMVSPTVTQPKTLSNSASAFLPPTASSAGMNNAIDGILAYLRKTDENQLRVEKKLDDFILLVSPLIKDSTDFAKSTASQLNDFDEWRKQSTKQQKDLKRAVDALHEKIPDREDFTYSYLSKSTVDSIDVGRLNAQRLATRLQKAVYKANSSEMKKKVDDRADQGAVKWIFDCVLHRRDYSTPDLEAMALSAMRERLDQYAGNAKRARKNPIKAFTKNKRPNKRFNPNKKPSQSRKARIVSSESSRSPSPNNSRDSSPVTPPTSPRVPTSRKRELSSQLAA